MISESKIKLWTKIFTWLAIVLAGIILICIALANSRSSVEGAHFERFFKLSGGSYITAPDMKELSSQDRAAMYANGAKQTKFNGNDITVISMIVQHWLRSEGKDGIVRKHTVNEAYMAPYERARRTRELAESKAYLENAGKISRDMTGWEILCGAVTAIIKNRLTTISDWFTII